MKLSNKLVLSVLAIGLAASSACAEKNIETNVQPVTCDSWEKFDKLVDLFVSQIEAKNPHLTDYDKAWLRCHYTIALEDLMPKPTTWLEKHPSVEIGLAVAGSLAFLGASFYVLNHINFHL